MFRHLEDNLLYHIQRGFRGRLSTETQLATLADEFTLYVSCGGQFDAIILDFSKAFDKVCHNASCINEHYTGMDTRALLRLERTMNLLCH